MNVNVMRVLEWH